jgi:hypothetical protein
LYYQSGGGGCGDFQGYDDVTSCTNSNTGNWSYGTGYGGAYGSGCCHYHDSVGYMYFQSFCSDQTLKTGIETLENSLESINKLRVVEFDWNENAPDYLLYERNNKIHSLGLIAQDVRNYFPEIVKMNRGYYYIEYPKLNAHLVEAIKEQQVFINELNEELKNLEEKVKNA